MKYALWGLLLLLGLFLLWLYIASTPYIQPIIYLERNILVTQHPHKTCFWYTPTKRDCWAKGVKK